MDRSSRFPEVQVLYEQAMDVEPLVEELYHRLMLCQSPQDQRAETIEVYHRCRRQLSIILDILLGHRDRGTLSESCSGRTKLDLLARRPSCKGHISPHRD
jgi:hypothetical protein